MRISRAAVLPTLGLTGLLAVACSLSSPDMRERSAERSDALAVDAVPGYQHTLAKSLFDVGPGQAVDNSLGFERTTGAYGIFARRPTTGFVTALPNTNAPSRTKPALTNVGAVHNQQVLSYFLAAGLPADQVDRVNAHATMHQAGTREQILGGTAPKPVFDWYSSVVSRSIAGVRVSDSFAWARFNSGGAVVSEAVFWPDIPVSAVNEAHAFQAFVTASSWKGVLPADVAEPVVVIHHTSASYDGPFVARASIDSSTPGRAGMGIAHMRHFDLTGKQFQMPEELVTGQGMTK